MADLGAQLQVQLAINEALKERQKLLENNSKLLGKQSELAASICKSLDCSGLEKMETAANGFKDAMNEATDQAKDGVEGLEETLFRTSDVLDDVTKKASKLSVATMSLKGLTSGFKMGINILKGFGKAVFGVVGSLFKLGKSIIMLPFRMLGGLIKMANRGGGVSPFRVALEELRKEMGNFREGPAKDVVDATYNLRKGFNDTRKSSVRFSRIFGYGREGMAAGLKFNMELMKGIGPLFGSMSQEFKKNAYELSVFSKGMGINAETMGKIIAKSKAAGKDYMDTFYKIGHFSKHLAKEFKLSRKQLASTTAEMLADIEHFGGMGEKALVALAAQSLRTGVSLKTLQKIVDGFDNFEDAAKRSAMLRRQFGMMINARKMLTMDAGERQAYLRAQFHKTGRSFESMGRLEQKALAASLKIGMDEAQMLFGKGNKTKKLTDAQKAANKAQAIQINQMKLLKKLTQDIERVFSSGGGGYDSFFAAFVGGIEKGIRRSREFYTLMRNIRKSLRVVELGGIRVGRAFVDHFPGVKQMIGALNNFFDPSKVVGNMRKVSDSFERFFKALQDPRKTAKALDELLMSLRNIFLKQFGDTGQAEIFAKAADTFLTIIGNIKLMLLEKALDTASTFIMKFADGLLFFAQNLGAGTMGDAATVMGDAFTNRFGDAFTNLASTFKEKFLPAMEYALPVIGEALILINQKIRDFFADEERFTAIADALMKSMEAVMTFKAKFWMHVWNNNKGLIMKLLAIPLGLALAKGAMMGLGTALMTKLIPIIALKLKALAVGLIATGGQLVALIGAGAAAGVGAAFIGIGVAIGNAFYEGFKGFVEGDGFFDTLARTLMGALGGIIEVATLGIFDADAMMDSIFGSTRVRDNMMKEQAKETKENIKAFKKETDPIRKAVQKEMMQIAADAKKAKAILMDLKVFRDKDGKLMSDKTQTTLDKLAEIQAEREKIGKNEQARIVRLQEQHAKAANAGRMLLTRLNSELSDSFKNDISVAVDKAGARQVLNSLEGKLTRQQMQLVTYKDGILKIHNDLFDDDGEGAIIKAALEEAGSSATFERQAERIRKAAEAATSKLKTISTKEIEAVYIEAEKAGAPQAAKMKEMLDARLKKRIEGQLTKDLDKIPAFANNKDLYDAEFKRRYAKLMKVEQDRLSELVKPPATEEEKFASKMGQLEAAASTVKRIKELQQVPKQLKEAKKSFMSIDMTGIKDQVANVFEKAGEMSKHINKAVTDAGLHKSTETLSPAVMQNFEGINKAREAIDNVVGKTTVTKSKIAARKSNIIASFAAIGAIRDELIKKDGPLAVSKSIDKQMTTIFAIKTVTSGIAGPDGVFDQGVDNLAAKIKGTRDAVKAIGKLASDLQKVKPLVAGIELGEKFTSGQDVKVAIKNANINLRVNVAINARQFIGELLKVDLNTSQAGKQRLATTNDINRGEN